MKTKKSLALAAMAAALTLAIGGCARTAAIYTVNEAPVQTASGKALSAAQVRAAIMSAGAGLGWKFRDAGPGRLEGTLNVRTHVAVVEIPYTARTYAIKYKSSQNLEESNGTIHSNYNGWVQNLDRAIQQELTKS
jgi:hypothetical protein